MKFREIWYDCLVFSEQPKQSLSLAVLVLFFPFLPPHLDSLTAFALVQQWCVASGHHSFVYGGGEEHRSYSAAS